MFVDCQCQPITEGSTDSPSETIAPTTSSSGEFKPCSVCGVGFTIGNPDGVIEGDEGSVTCAEVEVACSRGFCDAKICAGHTALVGELCSCSSTWRRIQTDARALYRFQFILFKNSSSQFLKCSSSSIEIKSSSLLRSTLCEKTSYPWFNEWPGIVFWKTFWAQQEYKPIVWVVVTHFSVVVESRSLISIMRSGRVFYLHYHRCLFVVPKTVESKKRG